MYRILHKTMVVVAVVLAGITVVLAMWMGTLRLAPVTAFAALAGLYAFKKSRAMSSWGGEWVIQPAEIRSTPDSAT